MACTCEIGIATSDRPELLRQTMESLVASGVRCPFVVSDDSTKYIDETRAVVNQVGGLYQTGPHQGAFANRNALLETLAKHKPQAALLCDDDLYFDPTFGPILYPALEQLSASQVLCTTITENGHGGPSLRRGFWGTFTQASQTSCIGLSNACFVMSGDLLDAWRYDATFEYGYAEGDLSDRMLAAGVSLSLVDNLCAEHVAPGQSVTRRRAGAARIYYNLKRLSLVERSTALALVFAISDLPRGALGCLLRADVPATVDFMDSWREGVRTFLRMWPRGFR